MHAASTDDERQRHHSDLDDPGIVVNDLALQDHEMVGGVRAGAQNLALFGLYLILPFWLVFRIT